MNRLTTIKTRVLAALLTVAAAVAGHTSAWAQSLSVSASTSDITVSAGPYNKGNDFYISVPFSEIVIGGGMLTTSWGDATYFGRCRDDVPRSKQQSAPYLKVVWCVLKGRLVPRKRC